MNKDAQRSAADRNTPPSGQAESSTSRLVPRRFFLQAGSAAVAGLTAAIASANPARETLAVDGGPKTVTFPAGKHAAVTRWPRYGPAEKQALHALIDSNKYYEELPLLEKEWRDYTNVPYAKAHMNGTSALTSMFFGLDLPPGSEILVPSYTFFATILPMRFFQYVPIFIDIDPRTACFDLQDAKRKLTPRTKALIPMHSWGLPCEMDHIDAFAKEKGLILLEDAAHAHGASMQGKAMGAWGAMGIYSFQASKVLPTVEGGMGMYQTREYYERAAAFGHYEDPPKFPKDSPYRRYDGTGFGQKYRMHPFAAAVARQQLKSLDERNALVASQVRKLNDRLTQLPGLAEPRCRPSSGEGASRKSRSSRSLALMPGNTMTKWSRVRVTPAAISARNTSRVSTNRFQLRGRKPHTRFQRKPVWNHAVFSKNRDRLLNQEIARSFFERVKKQGKPYMSDEHFTVDGTLIEAWASHKSFRPKEGGDGRGSREADFHGEQRRNDTHQSNTDPDARLCRKGNGREAQLCYMGHVLMENRNGLLADALVTQADGTAERDAALLMGEKIPGSKRATVGGDKNYDTRDFVHWLRHLKLTPHVAQNNRSRRSAIDGRTTRYPGYQISQRKRKRVEQCFGWMKIIGLLEKVKLRGLEKVEWLFTFGAAESS